MLETRFRLFRMAGLSVLFQATSLVGLVLAGWGAVVVVSIVTSRALLEPVSSLIPLTAAEAFLAALIFAVTVLRVVSRRENLVDVLLRQDLLDQLTRENPQHLTQKQTPV